MCAPSPPPPPDYVGAAREQGAANKEAAIAAARLNNPNVFSPYGSQRWIEGPTPEDRPTLIQEFSPAQQRLFDIGLETRRKLAELGGQGATTAQRVLGEQMDFSALPPRPAPSQELRNRIVDAMMARVEEDTARARDQRHSDLIAAGIRPGTQAYETEMARIDRAYNDARNQAMLAAGQEAQRAFQMDAELRRQALAELLAQRQTPLNEIAALMSGSQVQNPFAMPGVAQNAHIAPAPIFAAHQALANYMTDRYNAEAAGQAGLLGGLFSLGGAALRSPWFGKWLGFG